MRRLATPLWILGCLSALSLACYGRAFFRGEQFGYRDAAHYYYPLYQRVQMEWEAGRWPLWEPEENAGMPLLGNPTAAVLYPGKVVYAALPYAAAAKVYVVAHSLLAFAGALALLRGWRVSWAGAAVGGLSYAFGAPVLFQYCNVIYLVGAAWLPWGFLFVDRWLARGSRPALLGLAVVLAMETLGGDPEMAYLTGLAACGYALWIVRSRRSLKGTRAGGRGRGRAAVAAAVVLLAVAWVPATLGVAAPAPGLRPAKAGGQPTPPLPWMKYVAPAVALAWGSAGLAVVLSWRRRRVEDAEGGGGAFVPMLLGLAGSAVLAAALAAAQLVPVLEFTGQSGRAASDGPHEIYQFSLEPARVVEFLWPNVFGTSFQGNRSFLTQLWLTERSVKVWVPSIYVGAMTLVLALGALRFRSRGEEPWVGWVSLTALVCLAASFGEYTSPVFWARFSPEMVKRIGPHDDPEVTSIREDGCLRDGDGGLYWALATALPGFRQFRFPSKLLTLTVLGLSALAGRGWDEVLGGDRRARRRTAAWAGGLVGLTLLVLAGTVARDGTIVSWLKSSDKGSAFGPLDALGAVFEMRRGLVQGGAAAGVALALALFGWRRPAVAAAVGLAALTADLAAANARYVLTVPQSLFEGTPEVVRRIREAEAANPSPGPYRVHRMPIWNPVGWREQPSADRVRDFVAWERTTIQPKYGVTEGVHYTMTLGVAELYDYEWFFGGFRRAVDDKVGGALGVAPGKEVVVYPRRAFDMWTTRYFVTPYFAAGWNDENRGFASFLDRTRLIYPEPVAPAGEGAGPGPDAADGPRRRRMAEDYQIRLNLDCYPRAWAVHEARYLPPVSGMSREGRNAPMQEILYAADPLWHEGARSVYDPRRYAWVEADDRAALAGAFSGVPTGPRETVAVTGYESDRVEIAAELETPGMVILADVFYPGWSLTVDGVPAPIRRANRMMRGAAVPSGRHTLVYTYRPVSFRLGLWVSGLGLAVLGSLAVVFTVGPGRAAPAPDEIPGLATGGPAT